MKISYKIILLIESEKISRNDEIADKLKTNYNGTCRIIKHLKNIGVIKKEQYGVLELTPLGYKVTKAIKELEQVNFLELESKND